MSEIHGLGAHGIYPFLSDDEEIREQIKTKAGRLAYAISLGKKAKAPKVQEGIDEARGALKWIKEVLKEET